MQHLTGVVGTWMIMMKSKLAAECRSTEVGQHRLCSLFVLMSLHHAHTAPTAAQLTE
jgi:hypothetical protein